MMVNNADWLLKLNYIDFLRDVGACFSVNRMLTADCYKNRMEKGLTFLEFNYMIMQSYDFLKLNEKYDCKMQFGGNDQWSNIIGGVDLIRRKTGKSAYGMTFKLLVNSEGNKMGKTEKGALWLDKEKTSPYEFYQYWRNINDADVKKCLSLLTFIPMEEVEKLTNVEGSEINKAKAVLAYEVTKLIHGKEEAALCEKTAKDVFTGAGSSENMPSSTMDKSSFSEGIDILSLLVNTNLASSKSEARRLVTQGGISIDNNKISDINYLVKEDIFNDDFIVIKKGKKIFHKIEMK